MAPPETGNGPAQKVPRRPSKKCIVHDCNKNRRKGKMCERHYNRKAMADELPTTRSKEALHSSSGRELYTGPILPAMEFMRKGDVQMYGAPAEVTKVSIDPTFNADTTPIKPEDVFRGNPFKGEYPFMRGFGKRKKKTATDRAKSARDDGEVPKTKKRKAPAGKKGEKKSKQTTGWHVRYRLSPELADVCGKEILSRPQITKALWEYIRANDLQNPDDKREIVCDAKFRSAMGGNEHVTIFSMLKHVTPHLLEKIKEEKLDEEEETDAQKTHAPARK